MLQQVDLIVRTNLDTYLNNFLQKLPEEKHPIAINAYNKDIERIVKYCFTHMFQPSSFELTEDFIKWLHKSLYPSGFIQKYKTPSWKEIDWMVPGEYKKIDIEASDSIKKNIYSKPQEVVYKMRKLLNNFNASISDSSSKDEITDILLDFAIKFITIHPFGDGNGRLTSILIDLLCFKNSIKPFCFLNLRKADKDWLYEAVGDARKHDSIQPMKDFIEKHGYYK